MHEGWADSHRRQDWQAAASRIHSLRDAIESLLDLENWVCVDYLPGSAVSPPRGDPPSFLGTMVMILPCPSITVF